MEIDEDATWGAESDHRGIKVKLRGGKGRKKKQRRRRKREGWDKTRDGKKAGEWGAAVEERVREEGSATEYGRMVDRWGACVNGLEEERAQEDKGRERD